MNIFKRFVIILMLLDFIVSAVTGLVKFPATQRYFLFAYNYLSASMLTIIHDWSGVILLVLIIIHLIVGRKGLKDVFTKSYPLSAHISKVFYIISGIVFVIFAGIYINVNYISKNSPIDLSDVQVTEYQGEKLGSITDIRNNAIKGTQHINKNSYSLQIMGLVDTPVSYSYSDILKLPMYQKVVTIDCVEGWSVKALWEGALVSDLLKNVTIKPEAKTIIFYAYDGYSTSFPVEYVLDNNIIMADKINGVVLPEAMGFPFQLVAEQKWGYKWIKWITRIELSSDTNYKGFWESRGYNNNGDVNGSKFE